MVVAELEQSGGGFGSGGGSGLRRAAARSGIVWLRTGVTHGDSAGHGRGTAIYRNTQGVCIHAGRRPENPFFARGDSTVGRLPKKGRCCQGALPLGDDRPFPLRSGNRGVERHATHLLRSIWPPSSAAQRIGGPTEAED